MASTLEIKIKLLVEGLTDLQKVIDSITRAGTAGSTAGAGITSATTATQSLSTGMTNMGAAANAAALQVAANAAAASAATNTNAGLTATAQEAATTLRNVADAATANSKAMLEQAKTMQTSATSSTDAAAKAQTATNAYQLLATAAREDAAALGGTNVAANSLATTMTATAKAMQDEATALFASGKSAQDAATAYKTLATAANSNATALDAEAKALQTSISGNSILGGIVSSFTKSAKAKAEASQAMAVTDNNAAIAAVSAAKAAEELAVSANNAATSMESAAVAAKSKAASDADAATAATTAATTLQSQATAATTTSTQLEAAAVAARAKATADQSLATAAAATATALGGLDVGANSLATSLQATAVSSESLAVSAESAATSATATATALEGQAISATSAATALTTAATSAESAAVSAESLATAERSSAQALATASGAALSNAQAMTAIARTSQDVASSLSSVAGGAGAMGGALTAAGGGAGKAKGGLNDVLGSVKALKDPVGSVKGQLKDLAGTLMSLAAVYGVAKTAEYAARTEVLGITLKVVGQNAGYSEKEIKGFQKAVEKQGITTQDAADSMTKMIQAGLPLGPQSEGSASNVERLARAAQDLAVVTGEGSSQTFARLIVNIQQLDTMGMRFMGLAVDIEAAQNKYAISVGKASTALSQQEKILAVNNAALIEAAKLSGAYEQSMEAVGKKAGSLERYTKTLADSLGKQLLPAYGALVDEATFLLKSFDAIAKSTDLTGEAVDKYGKATGKAGNVAKSTGEEVRKFSSELTEMGVSVAKLASDNVRSLGTIVDGFIGVGIEIAAFINDLIAVGDELGVFDGIIGTVALGVAGLKDGVSIFHAVTNAVFGAVIDVMGDVIKVFGYFIGLVPGLGDIGASIQEVGDKWKLAGNNIIDRGEKIIQNMAEGNSATMKFMGAVQQATIVLGDFGKAGNIVMLTKEMALLQEATVRNSLTFQDLAKANTLVTDQTVKLITQTKLSKEDLEKLITTAMSAGVVLPKQFQNIVSAMEALKVKAAEVKKSVDTIGTGTNIKDLTDQTNQLQRAVSDGAISASLASVKMLQLDNSQKVIAATTKLTTKEVFEFSKAVSAVGAILQTKFDEAMKGMGSNMSELKTGVEAKSAAIVASLETIAGSVLATGNTFSLYFEKALDQTKNVSMLEGLGKAVDAVREKGNNLLNIGELKAGGEAIQQAAIASVQLAQKFDEVFAAQLKAVSTKNEWDILIGSVVRLGSEGKISSDAIVVATDQMIIKLRQMSPEYIAVGKAIEALEPVAKALDTQLKLINETVGKTAAQAEASYGAMSKGFEQLSKLAGDFTKTALSEIEAYYKQQDAKITASATSATEADKRKLESFINCENDKIAALTKGADAQAGFDAKAAAAAKSALDVKLAALTQEEIKVGEALGKKLTSQATHDQQIADLALKKKNLLNDFNSKTTQDKITALESRKASYDQYINALMAKEAELLNQIKSNDEAVKQLKMSSADLIRSMEKGAMKDAEKYYANVSDLAKKQSELVAAAAKGDTKVAEKLYGDVTSLAQTLTAGYSENGKVIVAATDGARRGGDAVAEGAAALATAYANSNSSINSGLNTVIGNLSQMRSMSAGVVDKLKELRTSLESGIKGNISLNSADAMQKAKDLQALLGKQEYVKSVKLKVDEATEALNVMRADVEKGGPFKLHPVVTAVEAALDNIRTDLSLPMEMRVSAAQALKDVRAVTLAIEETAKMKAIELTIKDNAKDVEASVTGLKAKVLDLEKGGTVTIKAETAATQTAIEAVKAADANLKALLEKEKKLVVGSKEAIATIDAAKTAKESLDKALDLQKTINVDTSALKLAMADVMVKQKEFDDAVKAKKELELSGANASAAIETVKTKQKELGMALATELSLKIGIDTATNELNKITTQSTTMQGAVGLLTVVKVDVNDALKNVNSVKDAKDALDKAMLNTPAMVVITDKVNTDLAAIKLIQEEIKKPVPVGLTTEQATERTNTLQAKLVALEAQAKKDLAIKATIEGEVEVNLVEKALKGVVVQQDTVNGKTTIVKVEGEPAIAGIKKGLEGASSAINTINGQTVAPSVNTMPIDGFISKVQSALDWWRKLGEAKGGIDDTFPMPNLPKKPDSPNAPETSSDVNDYFPLKKPSEPKKPVAPTPEEVSRKAREAAQDVKDADTIAASIKALKQLNGPTPAEVEAANAAKIAAADKANPDLAKTPVNKPKPKPTPDATGLAPGESGSRTGMPSMHQDSGKYVPPASDSSPSNRNNQTGNKTPSKAAEDPSKTIFKVVDSDGKVTYSNQRPSADAKPVDLSKPMDLSKPKPEAAPLPPIVTQDQRDDEAGRPRRGPVEVGPKGPAERMADAVNRPPADALGTWYDEKMRVDASEAKNNQTLAAQAKANGYKPTVLDNLKASKSVPQDQNNPSQYNPVTPPVQSIAPKASEPSPQFPLEGNAKQVADATLATAKKLKKDVAAEMPIPAPVTTDAPEQAKAIDTALKGIPDATPKVAVDDNDVSPAIAGVNKDIATVEPTVPVDIAATSNMGPVAQAANVAAASVPTKINTDFMGNPKSAEEAASGANLAIASVPVETEAKISGASDVPGKVDLSNAALAAMPPITPVKIETATNAPEVAQTSTEAVTGVPDVTPKINPDDSAVGPAVAASDTAMGAAKGAEPAIEPDTSGVAAAVSASDTALDAAKGADPAITPDTSAVQPSVAASDTALGAAKGADPAITPNIDAVSPAVTSSDTALGAAKGAEPAITPNIDSVAPAVTASDTTIAAAHGATPAITPNTDAVSPAVAASDTALAAAQGASPDIIPDTTAVQPAIAASDAAVTAAQGATPDIIPDTTGVQPAVDASNAAVTAAQGATPDIIPDTTAVQPAVDASNAAVGAAQGATPDIVPDTTAVQPAVDASNAAVTAAQGASPAITPDITAVVPAVAESDAAMGAAQDAAPAIIPDTAAVGPAVDSVNAALGTVKSDTTATVTVSSNDGQVVPAVVTSLGSIPDSETVDISATSTVEPVAAAATAAVEAVPDLATVDIAATSDVPDKAEEATTALRDIPPEVTTEMNASGDLVEGAIAAADAAKAIPTETNTDINGTDNLSPTVTTAQGAVSSLTGTTVSLDGTDNVSPVVSTAQGSVSGLTGTSVSLDAVDNVSPPAWAAKASVDAVPDKTVTLTGVADMAQVEAAPAKLTAVEDESATLTITENSSEVVSTVQSALGGLSTSSQHQVNDNASEAAGNINALSGMNTSSTHTIHIVKVEDNKTGGEAGMVEYTGGSLTAIGSGSSSSSSSSSSGSNTYSGPSSSSGLSGVDVVGMSGSAPSEFARGGSVNFPRMTTGVVPGSGFGDTVPRTLESGSFVLRNSAVGKYGSNLLNQFIGYAVGGQVQPQEVAYYARGGSARPVSAMLTPGEIVISPRMVAKYGTNFFNNINNSSMAPSALAGGRVRKFATGGEVDLTPGQKDEIYQARAAFDKRLQDTYNNEVEEITKAATRTVYFSDIGAAFRPDPTIAINKRLAELKEDFEAMKSRVNAQRAADPEEVGHYATGGSTDAPANTEVEKPVDMSVFKRAEAYIEAVQPMVAQHIRQSEGPAGSTSLGFVSRSEASWYGGADGGTSYGEELNFLKEQVFQPSRKPKASDFLRAEAILNKWKGYLPTVVGHSSASPQKFRIADIEEGIESSVKNYATGGKVMPPLKSYGTAVDENGKPVPLSDVKDPSRASQFATGGIALPKLSTPENPDVKPSLASNTGDVLKDRDLLKALEAKAKAGTLSPEESSIIEGLLGKYKTAFPELFSSGSMPDQSMLLKALEGFQGFADGGMASVGGPNGWKPLTDKGEAVGNNAKNALTPYSPAPDKVPEFFPSPSKDPKAWAAEDAAAERIYSTALSARKARLESNLAAALATAPSEEETIRRNYASTYEAPLTAITTAYTTAKSARASSRSGKEEPKQEYKVIPGIPTFYLPPPPEALGTFDEAMIEAQNPLDSKGNHKDPKKVQAKTANFADLTYQQSLLTPMTNAEIMVASGQKAPQTWDEIIADEKALDKANAGKGITPVRKFAIGGVVSQLDDLNSAYDDAKAKGDDQKAGELYQKIREEEEKNRAAGVSVQSIARLGATGPGMLGAKGPGQLGATTDSGTGYKARIGWTQPSSTGGYQARLGDPAKFATGGYAGSNSWWPADTNGRAYFESEYANQKAYQNHSAKYNRTVVDNEAKRDDGLRKHYEKSPVLTGSPGFVGIGDPGHSNNYTRGIGFTGDPGFGRAGVGEDVGEVSRNARGSGFTGDPGFGRAVDFDYLNESRNRRATPPILGPIRGYAFGGKVTPGSMGGTGYDDRWAREHPKDGKAPAKFATGGAVGSYNSDLSALKTAHNEDERKARIELAKAETKIQKDSSESSRVAAVTLDSTKKAAVRSFDFIKSEDQIQQSAASNKIDKDYKDLVDSGARAVETVKTNLEIARQESSRLNDVALTTAYQSIETGYTRQVTDTGVQTVRSKDQIALESARAVRDAETTASTEYKQAMQMDDPTSRSSAISTLMDTLTQTKESISSGTTAQVERADVAYSDTVAQLGVTKGYSIQDATTQLAAKTIEDSYQIDLQRKRVDSENEAKKVEDARLVARAHTDLSDSFDTKRQSDSSKFRFDNETLDINDQARATELVIQTNNAITSLKEDDKARSIEAQYQFELGKKEITAKYNGFATGGEVQAFATGGQVDSLFFEEGGSSDSSSFGAGLITNQSSWSGQDSAAYTAYTKARSRSPQGDLQSVDDSYDKSKSTREAERLTWLKSTGKDNIINRSLARPAFAEGGEVDYHAEGGSVGADAKKVEDALRHQREEHVQSERSTIQSGKDKQAADTKRGELEAFNGITTNEEKLAAEKQERTDTLSAGFDGSKAEVLELEDLVAQNRFDLANKDLEDDFSKLGSNPSDEDLYNFEKNKADLASAYQKATGAKASARAKPAYAEGGEVEYHAEGGPVGYYAEGGAVTDKDLVDAFNEVQRKSWIAKKAAKDALIKADTEANRVADVATAKSTADLDRTHKATVDAYDKELYKSRTAQDKNFTDTKKAGSTAHDKTEKDYRDADSETQRLAQLAYNTSATGMTTSYTRESDAASTSHKNTLRDNDTAYARTVAAGTKDYDKILSDSTESYANTARLDGIAHAKDTKNNDKSYSETTRLSKLSYDTGLSNNDRSFAANLNEEQIANSKASSDAATSYAETVSAGKIAKEKTVSDSNDAFKESGRKGDLAYAVSLSGIGTSFDRGVAAAGVQKERALSQLSAATDTAKGDANKVASAAMSKANKIEDPVAKAEAIKALKTDLVIKDTEASKAMTVGEASADQAYTQSVQDLTTTKTTSTEDVTTVNKARISEDGIAKSQQEESVEKEYQAKVASDEKSYQSSETARALDYSAKLAQELRAHNESDKEAGIALAEKNTEDGIQYKNAATEIEETYAAKAKEDKVQQDKDKAATDLAYKATYDQGKTAHLDSEEDIETSYKDQTSARYKTYSDNKTDLTTGYVAQKTEREVQYGITQRTVDNDYEAKKKEDIAQNTSALDSLQTAYTENMDSEAVQYKEGQRQIAEDASSRDTEAAVQLTNGLQEIEDTYKAQDIEDRAQLELSRKELRESKVGLAMGGKVVYPEATDGYSVFATGGDVGGESAAPDTGALPGLATDVGDAATIVSKWKDTLPSIFSTKGLATGESVFDLLKGLKGFAEGGNIAASDTVPAMLTPGEFVVPQDVVRNFGSDFFSKIAAAGSPMDWFRDHAKGYATGGMVDNASFPSPLSLQNADRIGSQFDFMTMPAMPITQGFAFEKGGLVNAPAPSQIVQVDLRSNGKQVSVEVASNKSSDLLALLGELKSRSM